MVVIPILTKDGGDLAAGLIEGFHKMGGTPEMLYADNETSMSSIALTKYYKENNITHIATRGRAAVAERSIRTFKDMLYKRIGNNKTKQWTEYVFEILLSYNNKMIHSSTKKTPTEAKKKGNEMDVKMNMEMKAKRGRKYESINVGDSVKIFKKKKAGVKQQVSYCGTAKHEIISIEEAHGQKFYKVEGLSIRLHTSCSCCLSCSIHRHMCRLATRFVLCCYSAVGLCFVANHLVVSIFLFPWYKMCQWYLLGNHLFVLLCCHLCLFLLLVPWSCCLFPCRLCICLVCCRLYLCHSRSLKCPCPS